MARFLWHCNSHWSGLGSVPWWGLIDLFSFFGIRKPGLHPMANGCGALLLTPTPGLKWMEDSIQSLWVFHGYQGFVLWLAGGFFILYFFISPPPSSTLTPRAGCGLTGIALPCTKGHIIEMVPWLTLWAKQTGHPQLPQSRSGSRVCPAFPWSSKGL